ncbi:MAG: MerR family transcriptional regulator [Candidatus Dormiibacterota bacterium]
MEYRIEQLAQAAGVAVDTIRFYQGKALLEPPRREGRITWYEERHLERLRRIRDLQQRGFTLTVIRRFLEGELASSDEALVEAVTSGGGPKTLSLEELAAASGIAAPLLQNLAGAGLLVSNETGPDGEPRYPAEDVRAIAAGLRIVEAGIPLPALLELGSAHARAVEMTARGAVDLFDDFVRRPLLAAGGAGDGHAAEQELLRVFSELLEASGLLVRHHFERALLRAARERIEQTAVS